MFGGLKAVLQRLKEKLTVPAAAFGVLGVSTTLACCYGPPPDYPVEDYETIEACESMLRECAQVHGLWSDDCTTDAMASCSESINRRAGKVFSTSASANYESSVLGLQDNKEITEAAALEALVMPWMNCAVKGVSRAESCQGGAQYIDVAHILSGNRFKDRNVRWIAAKSALESNRDALRARGYELAAAAIETDAMVDVSVAKVLAVLAAEKNDYALLAGLQSFGAAVIGNYSRVKSSADASAYLDAAKANVNALDAIVQSAQNNAYAEIKDAAGALAAQIGALEL